MPLTQRDSPNDDPGALGANLDPVTLLVGVGAVFVVAWVKKLATGQGATFLEIMLIYLAAVIITKVFRGKSRSQI